MPNALVDRFFSLYPELRGIAVVEADDWTEFGGQIRVTSADGAWIVFNPENHVHPASEEEALELVAQLLTGGARWSAEYRGDSLAATWIEINRNGLFEVEHEALYLCPFDPDEWTLWADETWEIIRTAYVFDAETKQFEVVEQKRESKESESVASQYFNQFTDLFGPAPSGFRWTMNDNQNFAFLAPKGWRRLEMDDDEEEDDEDAGLFVLTPESGDFFLRVHDFFRPAEDQAPFQLTAHSPNAIEPPVAAQSTPEGLTSLEWRLYFSDGEMEMMAIVELFATPEVRGQLDAVGQQISNVLPLARYLPEGWGSESEE